MSDDITFCGSECNNKKCFRHPSNIKEPQYPHSVALLEGTEYCEKKHKPTSVRLIDAEALRNEVDTWGCNDYDKYDFLDAIDNAPTVEINDKSSEIAQKSIELGRKLGRLEGKAERPHGDLISRKALLKVILNLPNDNPSYYYTGDLLDRERVLDEIDNAPTVEPTFGLFKEMLCTECGKRPQVKLLIDGEQVYPKKEADNDT